MANKFVVVPILEHQEPIYLPTWQVPPSHSTALCTRAPLQFPNQALSVIFPLVWAKNCNFLFNSITLLECFQHYTHMLIKVFIINVFIIGFAYSHYKIAPTISVVYPDRIILPSELPGLVITIVGKDF